MANAQLTERVQPAKPQNKRHKEIGTQSLTTSTRENRNDAHMAKVLTQDEALRIASNIARAPNLNARDSSKKTPSKPANELEGLIRDKLPDPVRRHLIDVIIDRTDADGLAANWTAQPVWNHDVSNNDRQEFISALFEVLREYDLLTDD